MIEKCFFYTNHNHRTLYVTDPVKLLNKTMTSSPVALVQGANRGLGLAFVRILANRASTVIATCRKPEQAEELQKIPNVEILPVDVTNEGQIKAAADHVKDKYGNLDLLINNAGLLHPSGKGETRLSDVKFDDLQVRAFCFILDFFDI